MGDVPTRSYLPIVSYQCRDRQGLKSSGYKRFYRTYFISISPARAPKLF
jgi:hypothetical protein